MPPLNRKRFLRMSFAGAIFSSCYQIELVFEKEEMPQEDHLGGEWAHSTLNRAQMMGQDVLQRTMMRKIEWPSQKLDQKNPVEDPLVYTTVDDAFASVLQFMSQTTRQCQRFYKSNEESIQNQCDEVHCSRFHTPAYTEIQHKNPLQRTEDVHVVVHPGTYAVTAGSWGTQQQQTHMVNVNQGQTVSLDFCM
ncbi:uncharacterized protein LOC110455114 [Mizuhopecten yessoensis]|uniref:uncharacterized protein LOC110455114 n=1 Tax=Mizuhopecten yessoensis TaxID=6573 RepID=UPI000B45CCCF|nr:uncharacterized protein LOC110455114 [Mizuhopecten yessoensis]